MAIQTRFDIHARVEHPSFPHAGLVVGIHKDRTGRVRLDVEYRDKYGKPRSDWFDEKDLACAS